MRFKETQLDNGLKIIGEIKDSAVSSALGFFVKTGARDETNELSGVSHFLEHMMFKGTEKRSAMDITFQLGAIGAQANAYTSEENTVYYMAVLPEYFSDGLELLSDMLRPSLDQDEFDTEKKVILEEIALYQDRPTHVLFESSLKQFFKDHTAGNSVLGSTESVSALSSEQMRGYFDARYTPSNITLVASGNFDWDKFVKEAKSLCGGWKDFTVERTYPTHQPTVTEQVIRKPGLQGAHCCMITSGPAAGSELRYPAAVLSLILGDGTGSKAYWEIVDKGLADTAAIDSDQMDQTGVFYAYVSSTPETINDVSHQLVDIMKNAKDFSDEDLARAKTKLASRMVLQGESSMRRLMAVGQEWTYRNRYVSLESEVEKVKAITREDINNCLEVFSLEPVTKITLLPEEA